MEQYLNDDYDVFEDKNYLTQESDIEEYFMSGDNKEYFDCGQGYYEDQHKLICKVGDKFFQVIIYANILSSKQEYGDRLYWVDSIDRVTYKEIGKPRPKEKRFYVYEVNLTDDQKDCLEYYMKEKSIEFHNFRP